MNTEHEKLLQMARMAQKNAYAPYSDFKVGAALLAEDGSIFLGCNIENASFSPTCCAERVALFKAVSEGTRMFRAIAIVGGKECTHTLCFPCGVCRQTLSEFCNDSMTVILENGEGSPVTFTLGTLLPKRFELNKTK